MPEVGIITTKSIGPVPRSGNREPVMTSYAPGCYMNAVGLTNPGADEAREQLAGLKLPENRFLLTSIFAGSAAEFVAVAKKLATVSHGLELNLSCPHAQGYGMDMGQDAELVYEIVKAVKEAVDIPVIPKLTPNVSDIRPIAEAAEKAGADAICAINTVGPAYFTHGGHPVLTNQYGGMSGRGILPIGLKCVKQIREVSSLPIIGCGGISTAEDVLAYQDAGADVIGVGSALTGMDTPAVAEYFNRLNKAVTNRDRQESASNRDRQDMKKALPVSVYPDPDSTKRFSMSYEPYTLLSNQPLTEDIAILTFDKKINIQAGEFIFLWIPGLGEKPFSVLNDDPFTLVVIVQGQFTKALIGLQEGVQVYVRGPYGIPVDPPDDAHLMLVAGGTGLAAVYQIARDFKSGNSGQACIFLGARSKERLYYLEECQKLAELHVSTDDGTLGEKGLVTESLETYLAGLEKLQLDKLMFYNCGPAPMVLAAERVQQKYVGQHQVFSAIDYLTKCGVGICGACGSPDGRRLCVDGPFLCIDQAPGNTSQ